MPEKENEAGRAAVGESGRLRIMVTSSIRNDSRCRMHGLPFPIKEYLR